MAGTKCDSTGNRDHRKGSPHAAFPQEEAWPAHPEGLPEGSGPTPGDGAKSTQLWPEPQVDSSGLQPRPPLPGERRCDHSRSPTGVLLHQPHPHASPGLLASRGIWWRRGQNKPAAHLPPLRSSVLTPPPSNLHKQVQPENPISSQGPEAKKRLQTSDWSPETG